jgi:peptide/nickel transport system permease protein
MPVRDYIIQLLPASILVFGIGTVLAFSIGLYLGKVSAWRKGGLLPGMITVSGIAFYTSFPPWLAFLIIYFVASRLGLPVFGIARSFRIREPAFKQYEILWLMLFSLSLIIAAVILINFILKRFDKKTIPGLLIYFLVGFNWLGSWYLMDIQEYAWEISKGAILPILTYTLLTFGEVMLLMRTSMSETVHEDYIWTARAKGLKESIVRDRHAARNALLPVMSRMLVSIPYFLTGLVMIERVFDWAGIGTTLFYAVGMQNITLALGMLIVIGILSMVVRLVLDVLQFYLNPRIRERNIYI